MPGRGVAAGTSGNALSRTCAPSRTRMGLAPAPLAADVSGRIPRRKPERRRARPGGRRGTSVGADAVNGVLTLVSPGQTTPAFVKQRARVRAAATLASDEQRARGFRLLLLHETERRPQPAPPAAHRSLGGKRKSVRGRAGSHANERHGHPQADLPRDPREYGRVGHAPLPSVTTKPLRRRAGGRMLPDGPATAALRPPCAVCVPDARPCRRAPVRTRWKRARWRQIGHARGGVRSRGWRFSVATAGR